MKRRVAAIALMAGMLGACLPQDLDVPQSPLLRVLERKSGMIAYIGIDANMYVSDQGGGSLRQLTTDATVGESDEVRIYQFPTWSTDSSRLAFGSLSGNTAPESILTSQLFIADLESEDLDAVYESTNEHPIYLYWSPNGVDLGFLTTAANPDMLILQSVSADGGERVILDSGARYYWTWAPDGEVMIAHVGQPEAQSEHLAFLQTSPELVEDGLDWQPASFQTPAWSPTGEHILFAETGADGENQIVLADSAGGSRQRVGSFERSTALAWAFDGTRFAYIAGEQLTPLGLSGGLHVVDLEGAEGSGEIVENSPVAAFFWSPDSTQIAYFVPVTAGNTDQGETQGGDSVLLLELSVIDVESGESQVIATYRPTEQFLAILPFFDQYHRSATIWSPDSNNLVISFMDSEGRPGIAVVAASGRLEPRLLAPGFLAFWSWR